MCSARRSSLIWPALAAALAVATVQAPPALAQGASTILVLDGSNSMNGRLGNATALKHVMVRDELQRILPKLPAGTALGLASFGHRRPSDCSDAELILPPAPDPARVLTALERFKPQGYSPVVLAMRSAAKALTGAKGKASIVLVLDDLASCRGEDPCAVAAELKTQNPALNIHVVGLGLKPHEVPIMACVAEKTGGRLFDAQDPAAAASGLEQVFRLVAADAAPAAPPTPAAAAKAAPQPQPATRPAAKAAPAPAPQEIRPGLHLSARLGSAGPVIEQTIAWRIRREGASAGELPVVETTQPRLHRLLPNGRYVVEAQVGLVSARSSVEIASQGVTSHVVTLDAGQLSLSAPLLKGGSPARGTTIALSPAATDAATSGRPLWMMQTGADDIVVPSGSYRVIASNGLARAEQIVQVVAGARREVELALAAGRLMVDATESNGAVGADGVQFLVEEDDPDSPGGRREITRSAAVRLDVTLPAGTYLVTARRDAAEARERVAVKAGEEVSRSIPLNAVRVTLSSRIGRSRPDGLPVAWRIEKLDGQPRVITRIGAAEQVLDVSAGRYRVEARIGGQNAIAVREVDVRQGGNVRLDVDPDAASLRLKLASGSGLGFGDVFWQIFDDGGQAVWRTSQQEPQVALAAGRYTVRIELRERVVERVLDVKGGDVRTLEIGG